MEKYTNFEKYTLHASAYAIVSMAFSVSLTHIFIFLSFVFFISGVTHRKFFRHHREDATGRDVFFWTTSLFPGALIFSTLIISGLINNTLAHGEFKWIYKSETSDTALFLFGVLVYRLSLKSGRNSNTLLAAFEIFIIILIASGFISSFSEYRLSKAIMHPGMPVSAANRAQHPALILFGIQLFQPNGFMNTRLTYAGLAVIIMPYVFIKSFTREGILRMGKIATSLLFLTGAWVLFLNNSRSAQAGLAASIFFTALSPLTRGQIYKIKRKILLLFIAVLSVSGMGLFFHSNPEKLLQLENRITRYTDYQRPVIWYGSAQIVKNNPLTGAGPGNFQSKTGEFRKEYIGKYPELLYFLSNTPAGHAHNDFLHLLAIGGIFAGAFYILMVFFVGRYLGSATDEELSFGEFCDKFSKHFFSTGITALFLAGLAQCYFQDDEVVVALWVASALLSASENNNRRILHSDSHSQK